MRYLGILRVDLVPMFGHIYGKDLVDISTLRSHEIRGNSVNDIALQAGIQIAAGISEEQHERFNDQNSHGSED